MNKINGRQLRPYVFIDDARGYQSWPATGEIDFFERRPLTWRDWALRILAVLAIAAGFAWLWFHSYPTRLGADFERAYWQAGWRVLHHPETLYEGYLGFVNLPIVAWLFAPFGWASGHGWITTSGAIKVTVAAGLGSMVLLAWMLCKFNMALGWERFAICALVFLNGPLINSVREGNLTHWVMVLLVGAAFALEGRKYAVIGVLLGLAAVLKPPLGLLVVWVAWRRCWGAVGAFLATVGIIGALSVAVMGWPLHLAWFQACALPGPVAAFNAQSFGSLAARGWASAGHLMSWQPVVGLPVWYHLLKWALIAPWILVCSAYFSRRRDKVMDFSVALAFILLASPLSWTHYHAWLLIPMSAYVSVWYATWDRFRWVMWLVAIAMVSWPVVPTPWMFQLHGTCFMLALLASE